MVAPKIIKLFRMHGSNGNNDKIYCRRHNRLYARCPVEENLYLCECLAQCEMALRAGDEGTLPKTRAN
jgi:hypothetical protein